MSDQTPLIEAPKRRGALIAVLASLAVIVIAVAAVLIGRGGDDGAAADGTKLTKVRLGVVGASDPYWKTYQAEARKQGIDLDVVDFADYAQPNPALTEGEIDINQFQHIVYLADYDVANDEDLVPIGSTAIYPLALYSKKYDSVADIKAGETVVVPDDDTNQARGLLVLQSAGLIRLKDGGSIFSTIADVDTAASKVKVKAIKADLTPASLPDVAAAIVNNDFVEKAGLKFSDAIAKDDPSDPKALPYVNIFAVRAEDKDNPTYRKLVDIYQNSQDVLDGVQEVSGGTAQLVKIDPAELEKSLADTEADVKAHS
jgi:D-methionine transport system substrate-binding protein